MRGKSRGKYPLRSDLISLFGKEEQEEEEEGVPKGHDGRAPPTSDFNVVQGIHQAFLGFVCLNLAQYIAVDGVMYFYRGSQCLAQ